ncbi:511_t:CDS:2 [Acaulospora colombiana]|uniref:511_t:CDS:1 n=1 Tax=Acaulospora colombiana TaxID=27376 RepID=A0ACA9NM25_9GLOM|nr:511_t:CDS:2 [Acaulospora colombiana]
MSTGYQPLALTPSTAGFGPASFYNNEDQDERDFHVGWKRRWPCWEGAQRLFQNNIGLLYIIASQLSGTCMNVIVKLLNSIDPPVPTFEFITYLFSITTMYETSVPHPIAGPPGVRHLLILRGLFGIYYSLVYLSLSDAIVITFLVPTTTAIAGYLLLHEALNRREIVAGRR